MTDIELLGAAAKAAGMGRVKESAFRPGTYVVQVHENEWTHWNPLFDDGDALRLAVKLRINMTFTHGLGAGYKDEYMQAVPSKLGHLSEFCQLDGDDGSITRRSIVRAAAAMVQE